jgi:hypothetical protein
MIYFAHDERLSIAMDHGNRNRSVTITGRQIAAGRALSGLDQKTLADAARISVPTLRRMEASDGAASGFPNNVDAVRRALEAIGVQFTNETGYGVSLVKTTAILERLPNRGGDYTVAMMTYRSKSIKLRVSGSLIGGLAQRVNLEWTDPRVFDLCIVPIAAAAERAFDAGEVNSDGILNLHSFNTTL